MDHFIKFLLESPLSQILIATIINKQYPEILTIHSLNHSIHIKIHKNLSFLNHQDGLAVKAPAKT